MIGFLYASHEVDVLRAANFIEKRSATVISVSEAVASRFAIWYRAEDERAVRYLRKEWIEEGNLRSEPAGKETK